MPVLPDHDGGAVRLTGVVTVEEAEPLAAWLRANPGGAVDLSACGHLHTAALQALLAARPPLAAPPPADGFLGRWVLPWLSHDPLPVPGGTS